MERYWEAYPNQTKDHSDDLTEEEQEEQWDEEDAYWERQADIQREGGVC